jgi:hypothetical protein
MPPYFYLTKLAGWVCWAEYHRVGHWVEWLCR